MTDFATIDITVASTRGDTVHNVGYHVHTNNLQELQEIANKCGAQVRVSDARDHALGENVVWVWIGLAANTSWILLRELSKAVSDKWLLPCPSEYP